MVSERFPALEEQEIIFSFLAPGATRVPVADAFNNWSVEATPLADAGLGEWGAHLMLRSGEYEHGFTRDGRWSGRLLFDYEPVISRPKKKLSAFSRYTYNTP